MKRYEKYKPSGVEWIGDVPEHWEVNRLKYAIASSTAGTWGDEPQNDENDVVCFRMADFDYHHGCLQFDKITYRNINESQFASRRLKDGDLLLEKSGGGEVTPVGRVVRYNYNGKATCSNFIQKLTPIDNASSIFLYYLFKCIYTKKVNLLFFNQTIGIQNLNVTDYLAQYVAFPPLSEQQQIASYLDNKTGEIDSIIAGKEAQVEDLRKYRQSLISETVTKGLNPHVPRKASGVEWIGEMPEHWEVKTVKRIFNLCKGLTITKADLVDKGLPVINYGQIHSKLNSGTTIKDELVRFIPQTIANNNNSAIMKIGDVVFADTSEDLAGCGNCMYIDKDNIFAGYHTIILHALNESSKYLVYLFQADEWRTQLRTSVGGVKVFSVTQSILGNASVIFPPLLEQQAIAAYLDEKCEKIDSLLSDLAIQIADLKSYKVSIISEAVTGQVDLRGWTPSTNQ